MKYGRFTTIKISKYEHFTHKINGNYSHLVCLLWFPTFSAVLTLFTVAVTSVSRRRKKNNRGGHDRNRVKNRLHQSFHPFLDHKNSWGKIAVDLNLEKIGLRKNILCGRVIWTRFLCLTHPTTQQFCYWGPVLYRFFHFLFVITIDRRERSCETRDLINLGKLNGTVPWLPYCVKILGKATESL